MDADGSNAIRLTNNSFADEYPMCSPNGKKILFSTNREGPWKLYVMDTDGSNQVSLGITTSDDPNDPCRAAWSPRGSRIAFVVTRDRNREIYLANADGSHPSRLAKGNYPRWSPDGKKIAFSNERNLYVINVDGSNLKKLTDIKEDEEWVDFPSWSRNGTRLFFVQQFQERGEIYSMRIDGSDKKKITHPPGGKFYPMVSLDSSSVVYVSGKMLYQVSVGTL